ncbi:transcriptional regulator with XRE-family HTH domain [Neorhizobium galegae]|uniref:LexA family protein n=1 Tax=Neorhizobium galegae TaxID=399 RepID=UPI0027844E48|nr:helix-turn-helix domain-containing protein [Neorhizobium galegae]MDQ0132633.1 transcriptional regulator with XRE-family HTH domain [Neorhizobium galegae]
MPVRISLRKCTLFIQKEQDGMYDFAKCIMPRNVRKTNMRDETIEIYLDWIREGLKAPGMTQTGLAKHLGIAHPQITQLLKGKRNLKVHEIPRIAEYLGTEPPNVEARPVTEKLVPVRKAGLVEAGTFREVDEFDQSEPDEISIEPDKKYPNARRMFFEVLGDSMNDLRPSPIFPGAKCICVAYEDIAHQVDLRDGMVVVVQRTRDGGHFREWSVKQIALYNDRVEFLPRSTNPKHKPIVIRRDSEADDGVTVEIIGLVRHVINDFPDFD